MFRWQTLKYKFSSNSLHKLEDTINVIWYFKDGEKYEEDLVTKEEANNKYNCILGLLLGITVAELEEKIS